MVWLCACAFPHRGRLPCSSPTTWSASGDSSRLTRALTAGPCITSCFEKATGDGRRDLVGVAGYAGPPSSDGAVEIGYAIAEEHQRRGYATEAVQALIDRAFAEPSVVVVTATTYASLAPSIGVLTKTGFTQVSSDPDTGLLKYECRRDRAS